MNYIVIYTDGACSKTTGGWGAVIIQEGKEIEISGKELDSTNNRMELKAVIESLKKIKNPSIIKIKTDSKYVVNAFNKKWIEKWKTNKWKTSTNSDVKNKDLWEELLKESKKHMIKWQWVKGHGSDPYNIRADELAVSARLEE